MKPATAYAHVNVQPEPWMAMMNTIEDALAAIASGRFAVVVVRENVA
jgi:hypothetical protein